MKNHFLPGSLAFAFLFILSNCGSSDYNKEGESGDSATEKKEVKSTFTGGTVVGVTHEVEDYATWLKVYNETSNPDARISHYINVDNPREIILFELSVSHEKAMEEMNNEERKEAVRRAGVLSEPEILYFDIKYMNADVTEDQYRLMVRHEVSDFDSWKEKFDSGVDKRNEAGLTLRGMGTSNDNGNMVTVFLSTNNLDAAREMVANMNLSEAGVVSDPIIKFYQVPDSN